MPKANNINYVRARILNSNAAEDGIPAIAAVISKSRVPTPLMVSKDIAMNLRDPTRPMISERRGRPSKLLISSETTCFGSAGSLML